MEDTTVLYGDADDGAGTPVVLERTADNVVGTEHFTGPRVRRMHIGPHVRAVDLPRDPDKMLESFTLHPENPHLRADSACLFSHDGSVLVSCLVDVREYRVPQGVRRIESHAFEACTSLERIAFPDSLREIGDDAFFSCLQLRSAPLPDGVRIIGNHAFLCTALSEFRIPASLEHMGGAVLYSVRDPESDDAGAGGPRLHVSLNERNERFFMNGGFLCESVGTETHALCCLIDEPEITVPQGVTHVGELAFIGAERIRKLVLPSSLRSCDESAFALTGRFDEIDVCLSSGEVAELLPSNATAARYSYTSILGDKFNVEQLIRICDESMTVAFPTDYRVRRIIARLRNGVMINDHARGEMRRSLVRNLGDAVRLCATDDDVEGLAALCEVDAITDENIAYAVDTASAAGGVRAVAFLLGQSRTMRPAALSGLEL